MVLKQNWKQHYNGVMLGVPILLLCFAFIFLHFISAGFCKVSHILTGNTRIPSLFSCFFELPRKLTLTAEDCDLFNGEWVYSEMEPLYTSETCNFIDERQKCLMNGRTDTGYLHWRWKPYGCELPRFDPWRFLESMHNKVLGVIGDSISRNHAESLLCMLSKVEEATVMHNYTHFRSRRWFFPSYNFTISSIWSPFLAKAFASSQDSSSEDELHLDVLDNIWTNEYNTFDYMIISTGPWFPRKTIYYENNVATGCHRCNTNRNLTELGIAYAHRKVLRKVYEHIVSSNYKGTVIYRTIAASHFEDAEWDAGGICNRTAPAKAGELELDEDEIIIHNTELEEFERASREDVNFKLCNVRNLSLQRPDGHPGLHRYDHKGKKVNEEAISDCLHWCLPGPIDYWNDLLMQMLL